MTRRHVLGGKYVDVWRISLAALRRWYVLLPLLALTGILAMLAGDRVSPEYEGQAGAMITPEQIQGELANPYGSITNANEALGIVLNSVDTRRTVMEQGLSASYEIGVASRSTILQVSVRAGSPEAAIATGQAVLDLAAQELATRQTEAGLPPEAQYTLAVLDPPAVTAIVNTGAVRVQAVVGVLGAGLSLLVAVLFDDVVGLWKRARGRGSRREPKRASGERAADRAEPATDATAEVVAGSPDLRSEAPDVPDPVPPATPRRGLSRRKAEAAPVETEDVEAEPIAAHGDNGDRDRSHAGLSTASPSINSALINTNEWVWPGDQHLEEAIEAEEEHRRRNPFFDPEFTKRQLEKKSKRTEAPVEKESESGATTSSGAAPRP